MQYETLSLQNDIVKAERSLQRALRPELSKKRVRSIGYPSNYIADATVQFQDKKGQDALWWYHFVPKHQRNGINLFGIDDSDGKSTLKISFQFNHAYDGVDRSLGGVFLRDVDSGQIVLAHRGIMTRGKSRVKKMALLNEFSGRLLEVEDAGRVATVIWIAPVDSPSLVADLQKFGRDARAACDRILAKATSTRNGSENGKSLAKRFGLPKPPLKAYFHEFFGKSNRKAQKATVAACYHGEIVKELASKLKEKLRLEKNQPVDLAAWRNKELLIFEVKTSTSAQSIYTGLGQLLIHGDLHRPVQGTVSRVLVLPALPDESTESLLKKSFPINFVAYERQSDGTYLFEGLDDLFHR